MKAVKEQKSLGCYISLKYPITLLPDIEGGYAVGRAEAGQTEQGKKSRTAR